MGLIGAMDPITGGEAVIEALLTVIDSSIKLATIKIIRENFTKKRDLELKILEEWKKGDQADLAKISDLEQQMAVYNKAIVDEIQLAKSQAGAQP